MNASKLIDSLEKLLTLHEQLFEIATEKTVVLKENKELSHLQELLKKEQLLARKIQQTEQERIFLTKQFLNGSEDQSLTACINKAEGTEKDKLQEMHVRFIEIMSKLKAANYLNQQLTHQALQFINFTLDTVMPQEKSVTYRHPNHQTESVPKQRSMFDSKA